MLRVNINGDIRILAKARNLLPVRLCALFRHMPDSYSLPMPNDDPNGTFYTNVKAGESGAANLPKRSVFTAMWRGFRKRCPACGQGQLFRGYLKIQDYCPSCGEALYHHRADDAPPYFTVFGAGHLIIPLMLTVETLYAPPLWLHLAIFLPLTALLCLIFLPKVKGAVVGLQWALYMHGFDPNDSEETEIAAAEVKDIPLSGLR